MVHQTDAEPVPSGTPSCAIILRPAYEYTGETTIEVDSIVDTPDGSFAMLKFDTYGEAALSLVRGHPYLLFTYIQGECVSERRGRSVEECGEEEEW